MRFVMIDWEDSHTIEGWHHLDGPLDDGAVLCRSAGWLVLDGANVKTIAPHITEDDETQACGNHADSRTLDTADH